MSKKLTLHLIQYRVTPGEVDKSLRAAGDLIASASPRKGDLILLPELFATGFHYAALGKMADRYQDVVRWMTETATRSGAGIAGTVAVKRPEGIANTMMLVDGSGQVLASYDKIHLFFAAEENLHFAPGHGTVVTHWDGRAVGLAICFDLRFPEMVRKLGDEGAQVVLVSAQWPLARVDHFRDFTRVRAMENQLFVVSCNSCGDDGRGLILGGGSTVVDPSGEVMGALGREEGVLTLEIDLKEVGRVRDSFPVMKVRRRDLYG